MSRTRVVVTGIGATTPLGGDARSTWEALLAGRSGVRALTDDWVGDLPVKIAAPVAVDPSEVLERVEARRLDRSAQLAVIAALEAWRNAGYGLQEDNPVDRDRLGVAIATGIGGLMTLLSNWDIQKEKGPRRVSPLAIPMLMANSSAGNVSIRLGARAGAHTPVSACASSNESISLGLDMIRLGRADVVVVGGTEACIHPLPIACFAQMQAMSRRNDEPERASRPWDVDRDGFVLAEGAAMFVIERLEHAQARGARIWGELAGAGITADSHDMVQPNPTGETQVKAMANALREADLAARRHRARQRPRDVDAAGRRHRGQLDPAVAGSGHRGDRHRHQVDDRPPARRRRGAGVAGHPAGPPPPQGAARRSTWTTPSPTWASTSPPRSATSPTGISPRSTTRSASVATTWRSPSPTPTQQEG